MKRRPPGRRRNLTRWSHTAGTHGDRTRAYERSDRRSGGIWVDLVDPDPAARGRRVRMRLPGAPATVRDENGAVDPSLEQQAVAAHHAFRRVLNANGRIPEAKTGPGAPPQAPAVSSFTITTASKAAGIRTLREGFDAFLDLKSGRFVKRTTRWRAIEHASRVLIEHFGASTPWHELTATVMEEYWRDLAAASASVGGSGARRAEIIIDAFYPNPAIAV